MVVEGLWLEIAQRYNLPRAAHAHHPNQNRFPDLALLQVVFAHIGTQYSSLGKSYCPKTQPDRAAQYQLQFLDLALLQVVFAAIWRIAFLIWFVIA